MQVFSFWTGSGSGQLGKPGVAAGLRSPELNLNACRRNLQTAHGTFGEAEKLCLASLFFPPPLLKLTSGHVGPRLAAASLCPRRLNKNKAKCFPVCSRSQPAIRKTQTRRCLSIRSAVQSHRIPTQRLKAAFLFCSACFVIFLPLINNDYFFFPPDWSRRQ